MSSDDSMSPTTDENVHPSRSDRPGTAKPRQPLRRASVACVACRDRRIKCNGGSGNRGEPCSPCTLANRACVFRFDDRRKRSSSKAYLQHLQDRIAALELGQSSSQYNPKMQDSGSLAVFNLAPGPPDERGIHPPPAYEIPQHGNVYPALRVEQNCLVKVMLNRQSMKKDFGLLRATSLTHPLNPSPSSSMAPWINGTTRHMVDRLCSTNGNLSADENGQLHYFGYTSNLQVASFLPPSTPLPSPPPPSLINSREDNVQELADSISMKTHLLKLYFTYQHPALLVLNEETFMVDYARGVKTQYFSPFLLYSVLLRSIRLSGKAATDELAGVYLHRAKAELLAELDNPTIATIQALCIFGHYLGSLGNDRACWLYPGMAFRLIYDFGLHQDSTDLMSAGCLTENDRKVRHVTLWGCYILDKLYSSFQGRPSTLKLADITVPRPTLATVGPQHQLLSAWTELATILDDIINVINGPSETLEEEGRLSKLSTSGSRLLQWLRDLPADLQWDSKKDMLPSPGICALHMQFLTTTILLHRPFAAYMLGSESGGNLSKRRLDGYSPTLSQQICTVNAMRISKLLLAFQRQYGIEKIFSIVVHIILTAALSLISDISTEVRREEKQQERKWLIVCFNILSDLTPSSPVAGRNLKILMSILECCGYSELAHPSKLCQPGTAGSQMNPEQAPIHQTIEAGASHKQNSAGNPESERPSIYENADDLDGGIYANPNVAGPEFELADFFPQLVQPINFGNWTPNTTFSMDMDHDKIPLQGFEQIDDFSDMPEFTSGLPYV